MVQEFKKFIMRGNVLDLAVAVIIGAAFTAIVNSLVNDILMPIIGLVIGKIDFSNLFISLDGKSYATLQAAKDVAAPTINYGLFIQAVIQFLIIAWVVFMLVKAVNRLTRSESLSASKDCPYCFSKINGKATRCPNCTSELS